MTCPPLQASRRPGLSEIDCDPLTYGFLSLVGHGAGTRIFNMHKPEAWGRVLQSRKKSKRLIRNCLVVAMDQVADGGHVHWEWPKDLQPYRWPELKQVFREGNLQPVICDGCMLGVKAPDTGLHMTKP